MLRLLVSYHFHRKTDLAALVETVGGDVDLFADSGAYSAATTGAGINLTDYTTWLRDWAPLFTVRANLDVIGDYRATERNFHELQDSGCDPLPVFHAGEPWQILEKMCASYRYVALGGVARMASADSGRQKELMRWLVRAFLTGRDHGTVFHGFGVTSASLARDLPFYSLDSSSYSFAQRWALLYLWDARNLKMHAVFIRNRAMVRQYRDLFPLHGLSPAEVAAPGFMRAATGTRRDDRLALTSAAVCAYRRMERTLTIRHSVAPPPLPRAADPGTKVYLAVPGSSHEDLEPLRLGRNKPTL